jgi:hypothetical protein
LGIQIKLGQEVLTAIGQISIALSIRSGDHKREPLALEVMVSRTVATDTSSMADLLTFNLISGDDKKGGISPSNAEISLTDDHSNGALIGKWTLEQVFVESYEVRTETDNIQETSLLRGNKIKYSKQDGGETSTLDITSLGVRQGA